MSNFIIGTVPADALAPIGARASAGIVMTMMIIPYISLRNSTRHIGGHSVHQCAYLWWSSINFGGPKTYAVR